MNKYEIDYAAWAHEQAGLLRSMQFTGIDFEHIAEELETIMGNEQREIFRRLRILIAHLLKWQYQPGHRSRSWEASIDVQRTDIAHVLKGSPSLKPLLDDNIAEAYPHALTLAYAETGLPKSVFPNVCSYTKQQILDSDFWPD